MTTAKKWIQLLISKPERDLSFQLFTFLSGPHNRMIRQEIMSELKGVKVPIAKSGVTAIQEAIMNTELWQLGEKLRTIGMEDSMSYAVKVYENSWEIMRFYWMHPDKGFYPHFVLPSAIDVCFTLNTGKLSFKDRNNVIHNL
jgi:hypothetical protein